MKIIIDTNIIFSILISKNKKFIEIFMDSEKKFYAPNYVVNEIFQKKEKILKYSNLAENELIQLLNLIFEKIYFINNEIIWDVSKHTAYDLCYKIDPKDIPFVALSIELNAPLWTGDKKLKQGLLEKGFNLIFNY